jgi:hypothetical protein
MEAKSGREAWRMSGLMIRMSSTGRAYPRCQQGHQRPSVVAKRGDQRGLVVLVDEHAEAVIREDAVSAVTWLAQAFAPGALQARASRAQRRRRPRCGGLKA